MAARKFPGQFVSWFTAAFLAGSAVHATEPDSVMASAARTTTAPRFVDRPGSPHAAARNAAGTTAQYYGGPVTENAKIYVLWWGDPTKINPAVTATKGGIADFLAGIMNSSYIDWLNEYNTTINAQAGSHMGMAGTGQRIGRGNYAGTFTLQNVPSGNVTDAQIQATLDQALTAGALPPPDDNTLYSVFFPKGVSISLDGATSCSGFGAYHDAIIETQRKNVYYLVIPDCGGSFNSFTAVTSHELVEAITDNIATSGNMPDYPQAWNDSMGDETADLCESGANTTGTVMTPLGTFTVQNIWDERTHACKVFSSDANDFNVALSPNTATVAPNATTTYAVQTTSVAGSAQMLTLSAKAPMGVTATVSPTTIMAGGTATLTVTATQSSQAGLQVVVRADATTGSSVQTHTAALLLSSTDAVADLGAAPSDLGEGGADLAPPAGAGGGSDDMGVGGVGGNGAPDSMSKGCGCAVGAATTAGVFDRAGAPALLLLLTVTGLVARRRRASRR